MLQAAFTLAPESFPAIFGADALSRIRRHAAWPDIVVPGTTWRDHAAVLREAEVLFSSWGAPLMDDAFLATAPRLKAVFYAGGSIRYFTTPALWRRGVRVTSAYAINAIPVSEYTVAAVLFGLKNVFHHARRTRALRAFPVHRPVVGAFGTRVGLVSFGVIARLVRERLRAYDVQVAVYDPFLTADDAARAGVERVSLDELFAVSDVVSVHTPQLPETLGLIGGAQLRRLRPFATFINTARGGIVHEAEMVDVLRARPDLQAVLDVTEPEPPAEDSPLYDLPNVLLTPHIAGSLGRECERMGNAMAEEFERFVQGQPLQWELDEAKLSHMA